MKRDIKEKADIKYLLEIFYDKARRDNLLGPVFNDRIKNWPEHIAVMSKFWESSLFGDGLDNEDSSQKHFDLFVENRHFDRWITLFQSTIEEEFTGRGADEARFLSIKLSEIFRSRLSLLRF